MFCFCNRRTRSCITDYERRCVHAFLFCFLYTSFSVRFQLTYLCGTQQLIKNMEYDVKKKAAASTKIYSLKWQHLFLYSFQLSTVVVNQTSFQDDFSLRVCHIAKLQGDLFQLISDYVGFYISHFLLDHFTDLRNKNIVSVFEA